MEMWRAENGIDKTNGRRCKDMFIKLWYGCLLMYTCHSYIQSFIFSSERNALSVCVGSDPNNVHDLQHCYCMITSPLHGTANNNILHSSGKTKPIAETI